MSFVGASTESSSLQGKQPLFDDEGKAKGSRASFSRGLFSSEDEADSPNETPWDFVPKRQKGTDMAKSLLTSVEVPNSYVEAFDALLDTFGHSGKVVTLSEVSNFLTRAGLNTKERDKILMLVKPPGNRAHKSDSVDRGEFNVILALAGLLQDGEDVSLDSIDERKTRLPEPKFLLEHFTTTSPDMSSAQGDQISQKSHIPNQIPAENRNGTNRQTFSALDSDPWGIPEQQRDNGNIPSASQRITDGFSTSLTDSLPITNLANETRQTNSDWTDYSGSFPHKATGGNDFGFSGHSDRFLGEVSNIPPSRTSGRHCTQRQEESVTVASLPDKEGVFLFQYRNYEVGSYRRNSKVIRRYSDFVWLLDCLHKKYPFRQLPLLPPKRVAINGNHIATDNLFIEKRRRGLVRFVNALVRHPMLSQEQLVIMFLTVPTELSVWRKQATISISEEFSGRALPPTLEESLPTNLEELFTAVRSGIQRSASTYMTLCALMERLIKRKEGLAAEFSRFSSILVTLNEVSVDMYKMDTNEIPLLNDGIKSVSKHVDTRSQLLTEEAKAWDEGVLEDFKRFRDQLISMRDMFDRRDRYAKDNIPSLEKRISAHETKLASVRAKPEGQRKANEAERLVEAIVKDKESIVQQHARQVLIKECIRDEINYFQSSMYQISRMHQDWTQEGVKYAELTADCWRSWVDDIDGMPSGNDTI